MNLKEKKSISYLIIIFISLLVFLRILTFNFVRDFDLIISNNVHNLWTYSWLNELMIIFSNYIIYYGLIIGSIAIFGYLFYKNKKAEAVIFGGSMILGLIAVELIKIIFHKVRPLNPLAFEGGFSFVSFHSALSVIFFLFEIYLFKDNIKSKFNRAVFVIASVFIILLTGFSRVFLNVHWFSDVLGGFVLGAGIFLLFVIIYEIYKIKVR